MCHVGMVPGIHYTQLSDSTSALMGAGDQLRSKSAVNSHSLCVMCPVVVTPKMHHSERMRRHFITSALLAAGEQLRPKSDVIL